VNFGDGEKATAFAGAAGCRTYPPIEKPTRRGHEAVEVEGQAVAVVADVTEATRG